jgi:photosystem II stability/assembly factor-like uncharacterized protein
VGDAVYAATTKGVQVTADHGASWSSATTAFVTSGFALATDGQRVFAAADGLLRTKGPAAAWEKLHVHADAVSALLSTEKSVLAVSATDLLRSADRGATWSDVDVPVGVSAILGTPFAHRGGKVFSLGASALLVSSDDGASFTQRSFPDDGKNGVPTLVASTSHALFVGLFEGAGAGCSDAQDVTMTLYRSGDEGASWSKGENNLPLTFTDCYGVSTPPALTSLVEAGTALLGTTFHDGAFRSADDGATWKPIAVPADVGGLSAFTVAGKRVFAAAGAGGVARSDDDGATWTRAGLDGLAVVTLAAADSLLFAGVAPDDSAGAVYVSSDAGKTWARVDAQFDARVNALAWQGDRLFVGTEGQSVWSLQLSCKDAP